MTQSTRPRPHEIADLPHTLDAYAAAWTVLGRLLLAAPEQDVIDAVRTMAPQWPLGTEHRENRRGVRLLERSAQDGETARDVHADVQRLFTGPGHLHAPPYESVHLNPSGLVFDEETLAVRDFYRRFGLRLERQGREPDDHVAIELEMLATLAQRALDDLDAHLASRTENADAGPHGPLAPGEEGGELPDGVAGHVEAIGEFLEDHALLWHHRLGELTVQEASTSFVQGLGSLLMGATTLAGTTFVGPAAEAS